MHIYDPFVNLVGQLINNPKYYQMRAQPHHAHDCHSIIKQAKCQIKWHLFYQLLYLYSPIILCYLLDHEQTLLIFVIVYPFLAIFLTLVIGSILGKFRSRVLAVMHKEYCKISIHKNDNETLNNFYESLGKTIKAIERKEIRV